MNKKRIYEFLELEVIEKLEDPCNNCVDFDCKKNGLNSEGIIKKKYQLDMIDYKSCLKQNKKELKELLTILKEDFKQHSYVPCKKCGIKFFKHEMKLHTEKKYVPDTSFIELELVRLCKKCNKNYKRSKEVLNDGFKRVH